MTKPLAKIKAAFVAAVCTFSALIPLSNAYAEQTLMGYIGDVNQDMEVNVADVVRLYQHIVDDTPLEANTYLNADVNKDSLVDCFDLIGLRQCIAGIKEPEGIYTETPETTQTTTTTTITTITTTTTTAYEAPIETTTTVVYEEESNFISAPIDAVDASLPSQGEANLVIFYVDFPDCQYAYSPSEEELTEIAFGSEDNSDVNYPFESMSAFYSRSSKGNMNLNGKVFRYTTKENQSAYNTNKVKLAEECYDAFKDSEDFSSFDGDNDGMIDATLFTVPTAAGDADWWPCAGGFGDAEYRVDGMAIGHIITGNAQVESSTDYKNFNSSYLHEMGHCMGLPDYYLYYSDDYEGMHGNAGSELMDSDATTDFSSFSKLMLGWYRENQISVYDASAGSQTFTLNNAQTNSGNCVIIPYGELDDRYFSEYFIIEYSTSEANNSNPAWWQQTGNGIRIHHIKADLQEDYWWTYLKYQNGSEYTNSDDNGIRLIRIVNDTEGDNFFYTGDIIDNTVSGFGWYDNSENESIDPGITISIGELSDDQYSITISNK